MELKTEAFNYFLPQELIAQTPVEPRDSSRLLIMEHEKQVISEGVFSEIIKWMDEGDVLVTNDTRVIRARLFGQKPTGGRVEVFLLHPLEDSKWEALLRPYPKGGEIILGGKVKVKVLTKTAQDTYTLLFPFPGAADMAMMQWGEVPLPPYIKEPLSNPERYQTIFARNDGSTAAPTAALHFTSKLLKEIAKKGIQQAFFTLNMGIGSFRTIKTEMVSDYKLPSEFYCLPPETVKLVNEAKRKGKKIIACGTDAVRALESASVEEGIISSRTGWTSLFITPGYKFKVVDRLITNLHLPCSSHLVLVSAFANRDFAISAYEHAVQRRFRFFSFGDATLIF